METNEERITETLTGMGWSTRWHGPASERWLIAEAPGSRVRFYVLPNDRLRLVKMEGAGTVSQLLSHIADLNEALRGNETLVLGEVQP